MEEIFSPVFFSLTSTFLPYHTFLLIFLSFFTVLIHAIKTQVLKTLGLIGKKTSAVLFSLWIVFLIEMFLYYVSALRRCLIY